MKFVFVFELCKVCSSIQPNLFNMTFIKLLPFFCLFLQTFAFSPARSICEAKPGNSLAAETKSFLLDEEINSAVEKKYCGRKVTVSAVSISAGILSLSQIVLAADDEVEIEIADLPPPFVPVLFGLCLLVGVGLLTSSLGNVIDEEALLGLQSGARAKKEIERSRSSYFKKK
jgi:hypothetical protein